MANIVTRAGKGSPLTNTEVDANFTNLNNDIATRAVGSGTVSGTNTGDQSKSSLELGSVDNTADANKPVSTAQAAADASVQSAAALDATNKANARQAVLVAGSNIKTLNGETLLGSGNIALFSGGMQTLAVVAALPSTPNENTLYIVTG
jgi:hypothetical protein